MKRQIARFLLILGLTMVTLAIGVAIWPVARGSDLADWPYSAEEISEEISLSRAVSLIQDAVDARRAAVIADRLYVELPAEINLDLDTKEGAEIAPGQVQHGASQTQHYWAQLPYPAHALITDLAQSTDVEIQIYKNMTHEVSWTDRLISLVPVIIMIALISFLVLRGAGRSLGLSPGYEFIEAAKLTEGFENVAGIDAARGEIEEIVTFLKNPRGASRLGGRMPKGVLLDGPPGAGKTLLARAMAKEAGVSFMRIESSGLTQIFVGAGASKVRKAFSAARKHAPCIVFIDEIDAMGRTRGNNAQGGSDEKENTLNALLVELDGFEPREGIFVIAATNRPEILDPALTRSGRIDRKISLSNPDIAGRTAILGVASKAIKFDPSVDFRRIAGRIVGFSGADIANLVNEAALLAARAGRDMVTEEDYLEARDKMVLGIAGSTRSPDAEELRITAYHEAGHALIAHRDPEANPIETATILPRGGAMGYVLQVPDRDRSNETLARLRARLRVAVAGRVAEAMVFGPEHVTTGAMSDISMATTTARQMVTHFGMSELGFVAIDASDPFFHDLETPPVREVRRIIDAAMTEVQTWLCAERQALEALAEALLARETLTGPEIAGILADFPSSLLPPETGLARCASGSTGDAGLSRTGLTA